MRADAENRIDVVVSIRSKFAFRIPGKIDRRVPLAAYPRRAMLITIQTK